MAAEGRDEDGLQRWANLRLGYTETLGMPVSTDQLSTPVHDLCDLGSQVLPSPASGACWALG
jgi:hypothetical protein